MPAEKTKLTKVESELAAAAITPLLHFVDMCLQNSDIDYLKAAVLEMSHQLQMSQSISFIAGGNDYKEAKAALEIKTLQALIALLEARKAQAVGTKEAFEKEQVRQQAYEKIRGILG